MFLEFFWTVLRAKKFDKVSIVLPDFETIRNNTFFLFSFFLNLEIFETIRNNTFFLFSFFLNLEIFEKSKLSKK